MLDPSLSRVLRRLVETVRWRAIGMLTTQNVRCDCLREVCITSQEVKPQSSSSALISEQLGRGSADGPSWTANSRTSRGTGSPLEILVGSNRRKVTADISTLSGDIAY